MYNMLSRIITITYQVITTLILLLIVYITLVMLDYNGGIDSFIGVIIFQPLIGLIISFITISICILAGLPIRLYKPLNDWWLSHQLIPILMIISGVILIIVSFSPAFRDIATYYDDEIEMEITREVPDTILLATGWFSIAFFNLHFYPITLIKRILLKFKR